MSDTHCEKHGVRFFDVEGKFHCVRCVLLQIDELQKELAFSKEVEMTGDRLLMESNRLLRELQERYDKYAQHDRDCAVIDDPEYNKCSCGFLAPEVKRFTPHDHAYGICDPATCKECLALKPKGAEGVCPLCYSNYNDPAGKCPDHTEKRIDATLVHKDCAHGEIMVTHICAECGEKIDFV